MDEFEKFNEWRDQTIKAINEWPERLYIATLQEAYDHKLSYTKIKRMVDKRKPDLPSDYHGSAVEIFAFGITQKILDDVRWMISQEEGKAIVSTPPVSKGNSKKSQKRD